MDSVTTIHLLCMLLSTGRGGHQPNMEVLKSIYERAHYYYLAVFSAILVLIASVLGGFIASLVNPHQANLWGLIAVVAPIALVVLLISLSILVYRLNRLQRDYLDIIMVYDLLSCYF